MPYDKNLLHEILLQQDCRTVDDNGKILPRSNSVFKVAANRMALRGSLIQPHHVYTIINEDRNGFRTLVSNKYKIGPRDLENHDTSAVSTSSQKISNASFSESLFSRKIKLVLSAEKWGEMTPKKKKLSDEHIGNCKQGGVTLLLNEYVSSMHRSTASFRLKIIW